MKFQLWKNNNLKHSINLDFGNLSVPASIQKKIKQQSMKIKTPVTLGRDIMKSRLKFNRMSTNRPKRIYLSSGLFLSSIKTKTKESMFKL
jgi:hypothetical protein